MNWKVASLQLVFFPSSHWKMHDAQAGCVYEIFVWSLLILFPDTHHSIHTALCAHVSSIHIIEPNSIAYVLFAWAFDFDHFHRIVYVIEFIVMQCTLVASWIACAWSGMECGALSKAHTQLLIKDNSFC